MSWCHDPALPFIRTIDLFRYSFLFSEGGLYADLDFVCLAPLTEVLSQHPGCVVLGRMATDSDTEVHEVPNAIMYADAPNHPLWAVALGLAKSKRRSARLVEEATGPVLLREAIALYRSFSSIDDLLSHPIVGSTARGLGVTRESPLRDVVILPPAVFYPLSWASDQGKEIKNRFRSATALHEGLWSDMETSPETVAFTFWYHAWRGNGADEAAWAGRTDEQMQELGLLLPPARTSAPGDASKVA